MISLKKRGLPEAIEFNGYLFSLNTDFRLWIDFPERAKRAADGDFEGLKELFQEDPVIISQALFDALVGFYDEPRELPRDSGGSHEKVLDYDIDAPFIYAAFIQAYGIDLTKEDLHWHAFRALLDALPEDCTITKIMQWRTYKGTSKDPGHKEYMKLKHMWELPKEYTEEELQEIDEFNELFG